MRRRSQIDEFVMAMVGDVLAGPLEDVNRA